MGCVSAIIIEQNHNVGNVKGVVSASLIKENHIVTNVKEAQSANTRSKNTSCPDCGGSQICKTSKDPFYHGCCQRGNRKYAGYGTLCFSNLYPEDRKTLNMRKKSTELQVVSHICQKYDYFIHDKPFFYKDLEGGWCSTKGRLGLRCLINNTMLYIGIDENQHKNYLKYDENIRYDDFCSDFSGKYIFIRYNQISSLISSVNVKNTLSHKNWSIRNYDK